MVTIVPAALFAAAVVLALLQSRCHRQKIKARVKSLGGKVIRIERKRIGPFLGIRRGRVIYRFRYEKEGCIYEGWVKFGDLSGADWQLQHEKEA
ncbi:MAG TPA: hypothetical protein GX699_03180 [Firmicutes bacterium]|nr:hypothetical protein [Bacillota bacterium]